MNLNLQTDILGYESCLVYDLMLKNLENAGKFLKYAIVFANISDNMLGNHAITPLRG